ncbi:MAG: BCCT family transporter [Amphritea sp.]
MVCLVLYAIVLPDQAASMLGSLNSALLNIFNSYYIISVSFFLIFCVMMILLPIGKVKLGSDDSTPEFSNFSWFSMMFSAGMGIGLMFYSIGEPMYHFAGNPDVIAGLVEAEKPETIASAMRFTFLHWGFHAWVIYVSAGLAMGYFAYRHGLPLTIRSTLSPLFGDELNGPMGHAIDVLAVVATVLGISVTVGTGVTQLILGFDTISGAGWLLNDEGKPTSAVIIAVLVMIMLFSTVSVLTGLGRGVK